MKANTLKQLEPTLTILSKGKRVKLYSETQILPQDKEIKLWQEEVRKYKSSFSIACDDIENYKKQISELQAELQDLKIRHHCK